MALLLLFAFLAGFVTILAPCIWPLLPIVLSSSIAGSGGRHRVLGVTLGIMLSFAFFTLTISFLIKIFHLDPNILRLSAVIIITLFGLTMIFPVFGRILESIVSTLSGKFSKNPIRTSSGFYPGFLTGLSLGIVWSPCAGPILASISVLSATGKVSGEVVLITIAYVIGVGIPLFFFAYGGQKIIIHTRFLSAYTGRIQQIFGVIMLLTALAIFTNYDKYVETKMLDAFPVLTQRITNVDSNPNVQKQLNVLQHKKQSPIIDVQGLFNTDTPAPEFTGITQWLNSPNGAGEEHQPLTISDLKGKVVLIDFWTYTCINCIRTIPHVEAWYEKYKSDGFIVIGVHTPEFDFEHDTANVENAIKQFGITYPVAQDNNYDTWNAYNNEYWPAEYLIDANGNIRRTEFGEGNYSEMEMAIQTLLKDEGKNVSSTMTNVQDATPKGDISPETYLGSARMEYLFPNGSVDNGTQTFALRKNLSTSTFSYGGEWTIDDENATAGKNAVILYNAKAEKIYIILRPNGVKNGTVNVLLDGKPIPSSVAGIDVHHGVVTVEGDRLYNIVNFHNKIETHKLQLDFQSPGIQAYTITFG